MTTTTETTIQLGKKPRHQLRLPQPYFVVVDDWLEKLGEKSYLLWFKLLAKVDRTDNEKNTVKYSQAKLAKSLGISKPTLIKLLKSLYEYGFIEYKEWTAPNGNVAENIIVYEAPQNDEENLMRPLVKIRDWENRTNEKFDFTKKGGRPKKEVDVNVNTDIEVKDEVETKIENNVELDEKVNLKIDLNEEKLVKNEVNLHKLKEWASTTKEPVDTVIKVIDNMAKYPEPIKAMKAFINGGIRKINEAKEAEAKKAEFVPNIPIVKFWEEA
jgi:DNA-binding Lrp family transcriptional regulator